MPRSNIVPRGPRIALVTSLRNLVDQLETAADARPFVRGAVDNQHIIASLFRLAHCLDEVLRRVGRVKILRVELDIPLSVIRIQRCGTLFRVDDGDATTQTLSDQKGSK